MRDRMPRPDALAYAGAVSLVAIVMFLAFADASLILRATAFMLAMICALPIAFVARKRHVAAREEAERPSQEMLMRMVADLAKRTLTIAESKRTADLMIDASSLGMLALDDALRVKPGYAVSIESLLATNEIAGRPFFDVIRPLLTSNALRTTALFLPQLFDVDVLDEVFEAPSDLDEVEFMTRAADGTARSRYLRFHFERVREGDRIRDVFVVIEDVTELARLERELAQSHVQGIRKSALLELSVRMTSERFGAFVSTVRALATELGDALRPQDFALVVNGRTGELRTRLDRVIRIAGDLGLEAESVDGATFLTLAHALEDAAADAQLATAIDGETFLAIVAYQDRLLGDLEELITLRHQLLRMRPSGNVALRDHGSSVAELVQGGRAAKVANETMAAATPA